MLRDGYVGLKEAGGDCLWTLRPVGEGFDDALYKRTKRFSHCERRSVAIWRVAGELKLLVREKLRGTCHTQKVSHVYIQTFLYVVLCSSHSNPLEDTFPDIAFSLSLKTNFLTTNTRNNPT